MISRILWGLLKVLVCLYLILVLLDAIPVVSGALDKDMEVHFDRQDQAAMVNYSNGLKPEDQETYFHLSQGAEIFPWILFTAFEVDDSNSTKPFAENLSRYGLIPDPGREDGLPIGLTRASNNTTFGMEFVGITCAACHVSELRNQGKILHVDGATNMFDLQLFYVDILKSVIKLETDHGKQWRTLKRIGRQDFERYSIAAPFIRPVTLVYYGVNLLLHRDALHARQELLDIITFAKDHPDPLHPTSGFGRLDAFDGTRNFLLTRLRNKDVTGKFQINMKNLVKLDAPTKFPRLWSRKSPAENSGQSQLSWGFQDFDWLEWTLDTNSVVERNVTETLGAGATVILDPNAEDKLFESSIPIRNLYQLEKLSYKLEPPIWPADLFGAVNEPLAAKGKVLFQANCADCHEYNADKRTPEGLLELRGFSLDIIGTDATAALRISCPVPDIGALSLPKKSFTAEQANLLKNCSEVTPGAPFDAYAFSAVVQTVVDNIKKKAFAAEDVSPSEQNAMEDLARRKSVLWRDTLLDVKPPAGPYGSRPLYGIWAAAPYLHNGSVPTLYALLSPPEQRPKIFALGDRQYDPVKVGFVVSTSCKRQDDCLVDTSQPGSSNTGHLFGTKLSEPDRMALLEYLKTY